MRIGVFQRLKVVKFVDFGVYLSDDSDELILLPKRYVCEGLEMGAEVDVFLYTDSEDRPVATTIKPFAILGEITVLRVVSVGERGCFLDLGIAKDIFMPTKNSARFRIGDTVVVKIDLDRENRLVARIGFKESLERASNALKTFSEVDILPFESSELGISCVVNGRFLGMVFRNEIFEQIEMKVPRKAYVKKVRNDGKIDLSLRKSKGAGGINDELQALIDALKRADGTLALNYDSPPDEISSLTGLSKKGFKRALSEAIKRGRARLEDGTIRW